MALLPGLPDFEDFADTSEPTLDWRKALLPVLGSVALGGEGGGGGLLRGFLRGQQLKQQRTEQQRARRSDYLLRVSQALGQIDDPDAFTEAVQELKRHAPRFGVRPEELDVYIFPESKRKRLKQQRAAAVFDQLIKTNRFFEDASYDVDGEKITGRELMTLAGVPRGTRKVTEPITEEVAIPRAEEGGLARFLQPAGRQMLTVGMREREEEIPFTAPRRLTLGEVAPEVFAKSGLEHLARLPAPLDKDGNLDTVKIAELMAKAGAKSPADTTKAMQERVDKDRADFDKRMDRIQQQMNQAKTEQQFRAAAQAYNRLVEDFRGYKPWVGVKQIPLDVPAAVKQWMAKAAESGEGLSPSEKRLVDTYNKLVDQRTRLLQIVSASFDEDAKNRALSDIAALDTQIARLKPQVDRIQGMVEPAPEPAVEETATVSPAPTSAPAQAPGQGVSSDVRNIITASVGALKRQGADSTIAKQKTLRLLTERGVKLGPAVIGAVDAIVRAIYRPAPAAAAAPTPRAAEIARRWAATKQPVPAAYRTQLTPDELNWLRAQGVEVQ